MFKHILKHIVHVYFSWYCFIKYQPLSLIKSVYFCFHGYSSKKKTSQGHCTKIYCYLLIHVCSTKKFNLNSVQIDSPCSIISTKLFRCGSIAQPISIAICCTIFMPVCLACQDFLLLHTAFRKGRREGIPRAEATTAKARAVVLRTYSSMLSISGRIVEIMVAKPAACKDWKYQFTDQRCKNIYCC